MIEVDEEVEKEYEEFWKDIVEDDGVLNKGQIKKELYDFSMVMVNCSKAYSEMTCGNISKPNTHFSEVLGIFQEKFWYIEHTKDDVKDMIKSCSNIDELKQELIEYFDLEE